MSALKNLLDRADELILRHGETLPIMAMDFLKTQGCTGAQALVELAKESMPWFDQNDSELELYPSGTATYPIKNDMVHLGTIKVHINLQGEMSIGGYVEIRTSASRYEKRPIEDVTLEWLVISLKRADAIMRKGSAHL